MPYDFKDKLKKAITFPYKLSSGIYYPVVDFYLAVQKSPLLRTAALIDSGATFSVFRSLELEKLGIKLERGKFVVIYSANSEMSGYLHKVRIRIAQYVIDAQVIFSDQLQSEFNLLGRRDFFDKFDILIEEKRKRLHLIPL